MSKVSGEPLQDHWSSGSYMSYMFSLMPHMWHENDISRIKLCSGTGNSRSYSADFFFRK